MSNIYKALIDIIGTPPNGLDWTIYIIALFVFITVFHFLTLLLQMIFKWVGGIR